MITTVAIGMTLLTGCTNSPENPRPSPPAQNSSANTRSASTTEVHSCKDYSLPKQPGADQIPATFRLPSPLALPEGASVAATHFGRGDPVHYVIGPAGGICEMVIGATGHGVISVRPKDLRSGVIENLQGGGDLFGQSYGCEYIPEVALLVQGEEEDCTPPSGVEIAPLSTGIRGLYAALVWAKHADSHSDLWGGGVSDNDPHHQVTPRYGTVALYAALLSTGTAGGQFNELGHSLLCSLPDRQDEICTVSLSYSLVQLAESIGTTAADRKRIERSIRTFVEQHHA